MKPQNSYSRQGRLRCSSEFQELYRHGRRLRGTFVNFLYQKIADQGSTRFGIAVGRKYGKSVERNRIRRVIRAALRNRYADFPLGYRVVVEVLPQAKGLTAQAFRNSLDELLVRALGQFHSSVKKNIHEGQRHFVASSPVVLCC